MRGALAGDSAFCALRKVCRNLREVMQAAEDRYMEMYTCKLKKSAKAGDMKGWYGNLKGGWKLQGKKVGSAQYIRDEYGQLRRKLEEIRAKGRRYFASLLNTTSTALDRIIIEGLSPKKPVTLSLGDPPVVNETKQELSSIANGKAMGPDKLPGELLAELLMLELSDSSHKILLTFHAVIVAFG